MPSLGCTLIVISFQLFIWRKEIIIYPILYVQNNMKCVELSTPDYLIDIMITTLAILLQLSLRLYLRFVKKIKLSNEILSIKFFLVLLICNVSYLFPLPKSSQSFFPPYAIIFALILTIILFDHVGFNKFFMENHPKYYHVTSGLWNVMDKFHSKFMNVQSFDWLKSNQIQSHAVQRY